MVYSACSSLQIWVKVCLVSIIFFLSVSIEARVEKCLGLSVGDRILCLWSLTDDFCKYKFYNYKTVNETFYNMWVLLAGYYFWVLPKRVSRSCLTLTEAGQNRLNNYKTTSTNKREDARKACVNDFLFLCMRVVPLSTLYP